MLPRATVLPDDHGRVLHPGLRRGAPFAAGRDAGGMTDGATDGRGRGYCRSTAEVRDGSGGSSARSGCGRALAGQSESWREARAAARPRHHRLPRWPHQPRGPASGPARGRPAYGVDASFTLFLRHGRGIHAVSARDGQERERTRSHASRRTTPRNPGSPARNEPPGRAVTPRRRRSLIRKISGREATQKGIERAAPGGLPETDEL